MKENSVWAGLQGKVQHLYRDEGSACKSKGRGRKLLSEGNIWVTKPSQHLLRFSLLLLSTTASAGRSAGVRMGKKRACSWAAQALLLAPPTMYRALGSQAPPSCAKGGAGEEARMRTPPAAVARACGPAASASGCLCRSPTRHLWWQRQLSSLPASDCHCRPERPPGSRNAAGVSGRLATAWAWPGPGLGRRRPRSRREG